MLRGRESLIRVVGRRRRFLPNRQSLLSKPIQFQSSWNQRSNEDEKIDSAGCCGELEANYLGAGEFDGEKDVDVTCPVCGTIVFGDNYSINFHLDSCLARGTKRKLTQRTLLQMKFCSQPKAQTVMKDGVDFEGSTTYRLPGFGVLEAHNSDSFLSLINFKSGKQAETYSPSKSLVGDGWAAINNEPDMFPLRNESDCDDEVTMDDICDVMLETFIVGRRFSDVKEVSLGENVVLERDPHNVKDTNAIKVISKESEYSKVLGFLPRELAQYLSPLIENCYLCFEGQVTSVPKRSMDTVPIQIFCQKIVLHGNTGKNSVKTYGYLWKNAMEVIKSVKASTDAPRYQQNFRILIQEALLGSNLHLLTDDEKDFLDAFCSMSDNSQRLFIRLYTRKGPWFRMSSVSYPDIPDPQKAIKELSEAGYACFLQDLDEHFPIVNEILNLLTVSELREVISTLKQNWSCGTRRHELIASLVSSYEDGLSPLLPSLVMARTGACFKISSKAESLFWLAERLFFLNGEQDLSAFLLVDMGIVKYPTYNCTITEQIFSDRNDLLAYEEAIEVAQMVDEALDANNIELVLRCINLAESQVFSKCLKAVEPTTSDTAISFRCCFSASWVYSKIISLGVSFLERERRYSDSIYLLKQLIEHFSCDGRRGYWVLRVSVDLEHIGHYDESLLIAESGLLDPWVRAGSRLALQRRVIRLGKPPRRWKTPSFAMSVNRNINEVHVRGRPLNSATGTKSRFYGEDGEQCGVEQLALQHYAGEGGWQGVHTESGIWLTIFGLLMWDVMFSDVPNVFRTRFQTAPLDLETDSFYLVRMSCIESQLQKIHDGMAEEILIISWESHLRTACRGVNWDRHSLSELRAAVACVGGPCLALFCRLLAKDYRSWSSGMPDLLLWRFNREHGAEAKLVEVKGPKDRLSEQQRAWLLLLIDWGFNVEVCKIIPQPLSS